jgi:hypothetical protein
VGGVSDAVVRELRRTRRTIRRVGALATAAALGAGAAAGEFPSAWAILPAWAVLAYVALSVVWSALSEYDGYDPDDEDDPTATGDG